VTREQFTVAQVTPYPWEQHHEVNEFVERLSDRLCARGHRVVVVAPSDTRELVREGRAKIKAARSDPESVFAEEGCAAVLGVDPTVQGDYEFVSGRDITAPDAIVANDVSGSETGMESDENEVTIFSRDGETKTISRASKKIIARELVKIISKMWEKSLTKKSW
jgi:hypothetical protein